MDLEKLCQISIQRANHILEAEKNNPCRNDLLWDGHVPLLTTVIINVLFSINLHFTHKEKIPAIIPFLFRHLECLPQITGLTLRLHHYMKI